jgi:hypothetical protein
MTTFFLFKTIVKWTDQLSNQNNGDSTSYGIFAFPTVSW